MEDKSEGIALAVEVYYIISGFIENRLGFFNGRLHIILEL